MEQNDKPVHITEWDGLSPLPKGATDVHLLEDADALPTWDICVPAHKATVSAKRTERMAPKCR